jgi:hypothetical protein
MVRMSIATPQSMMDWCLGEQLLLVVRTKWNYFAACSLLFEQYFELLNFKDGQNHWVRGLCPSSGVQVIWVSSLREAPCLARFSFRNFFANYFTVPEDGQILNVVHHRQNSLDSTWSWWLRIDISSYSVGLFFLHKIRWQQDMIAAVYIVQRTH